MQQWRASLAVELMQEGVRLPALRGTTTIQHRTARHTAAEAEWAAAAEFDHVLVNADVEQCAEALIDSAGLSGHSESSPNGK